MSRIKLILNIFDGNVRDHCGPRSWGRARISRFQILRYTVDHNAHTESQACNFNTG